MLADWEIICGDCLDIMRGMADNSVDAVITDPPYGIGLGTWDVLPDLSRFTAEVQRMLKPKGFYAFFAQMPTLVDWCQTARKAGFHYLEHIVWVKRMVMPSTRLSRGQESILIWGQDSRQFYNTKGPYEDVRIPGILVDVATIDTLQRHIADLWRKIQNPDYDDLMTSGKSQAEFSRFNALPSRRTPREVNFSNVWSFLPENRARRNGKWQHPAVKPLPVMERLVEMLTMPGMLVLDPFAGVGTTGVACRQLGRRFIGIEISPEYCEIARQRLEAPMQGTMEMGHAR